MKIKFLVLTMALAVSVTAVTASAAHFSDTDCHWAEEIIDDLSQRGIVNGISQTEFNPDGTVTRGEFLKMAMEIAGIETVEYRSGECLDVTASDWYGEYVQSALDKGLIPKEMIGDYGFRIVEDKGIYSGYFDGDKPIKREEMAYIMQAAYQYSLTEENYQELETPFDMHFTDLSAVSVWALDGVRHAYAQGFIFGMEDGTFRPQETATRAQAAAIINNVLSVTEVQ